MDRDAAVAILKVPLRQTVSPVPHADQRRLYYLLVVLSGKLHARHAGSASPEVHGVKASFSALDDVGVGGNDLDRHCVVANVRLVSSWCCPDRRT